MKHINLNTSRSRDALFQSCSPLVRHDKVELELENMENKFHQSSGADLVDLSQSQSYLLLPGTIKPILDVGR